MMQVDLARKPKDFVRLAAEAGCTQVFIGMESVNPENLKAEGKKQNNVEEYRDIIKEWHDAGVVVHTGYIIGLPWDTKEQVTADIQFLMNEIGPDQASFFMLTPLPGSHDHREMRNRGQWMDPDFNKRDSFHATIEHPRMSAEEWTEAYENAWKTFYSKENMIRVLSRWSHHPRNYWNLMSIFFWYKNAALIEKQHPMVAGFFRLKERKARRPGYAIDSLPVHVWKRSWEIAKLLVTWTKFMKEMEEVWLQSRKRTEPEERWLAQLQSLQTDVAQVLRMGELQRLYADARESLSERANKLLAPLEDLSSKIIFSRSDLRRVLKQMRGLQARIQEIRPWESETAGHWLDEMHDTLAHVRFGHRLQEWHAAFAGLREALPSRFHLRWLRFDAINNRVVYSRQELERIWAQTAPALRGMKLWEIRPWKITRAAINDFTLTSKFAFTFRELSKE
jgi:hypothetical protein